MKTASASGNPRNHRQNSSAIAPLALLAIALLACPAARAQTCTTQSALDQPVRDGIATAARNLAALVQSNDSASLKAISVPEIAKDFTALQSLVASTAPRLTGGALTVEQVYLLDATALKRNSDGSAPDAQFFCSLNRTTREVDFNIPALPPGMYGFAMVTVAPPAGAAKPAPWRLSFLMRQDQGKWLLAGLYPKPLTAAGHDGLWYWTQARQFSAQKQPWNAWLYYQAAEDLLQPAAFVATTHLQKLQSEAAAAAPPALSDGISIDAPLVVKGPDGVEYRFIGLGVDDSLGLSSLDIVARLRADAIADPVAARKRNDAAAAALLAAYPELRTPFHGIWIYAETTGQNPFATEQPLSAIK